MLGVVYDMRWAKAANIIFDAIGHYAAELRTPLRESQVQPVDSWKQFLEQVRSGQRMLPVGRGGKSNN